MATDIFCFVHLSVFPNGKDEWIQFGADYDHSGLERMGRPGENEYVRLVGYFYGV